MLYIGPKRPKPPHSGSSCFLLGGFGLNIFFWFTAQQVIGTHLHAQLFVCQQLIGELDPAAIFCQSHTTYTLPVLLGRKRASHHPPEKTQNFLTSNKNWP